MDTSSNINVHDDNFISNLGMTFCESLHIQDAQKSADASEGIDKSNVSEEKMCEAVKKQETKLNMMCLKKSATFPISSSSSDMEADTSVAEALYEHSAHQTCSRSISLPSPLKLISAMKGSREKHGVSQVKLNVKWAPDVYDPVPTLLSHTVRNKKPQKSRKKKSDKKNGKKGQKGNSSRGGSSKDKQFRKLSGTPSLCYKSVDACDKLIGAATELGALDVPNSCDKVIGASTELDAFDVRSQDSYCGTSFLKKSVTEVHYSVAQAL
ncbi:uncharacterized protein LOC109796638 [Cajanus cajan]|uniref:uncharacterized protein LOC109796638 n=1 Tax=Cajanus cajan TaxID=3821 RepID=UPI00098DBDFD|nr:uncharacterized protein LOC109796638 [Cajanus cajan]XP_020211948.1 uncharacterized protein LOC109796638 [Cajanus cajan]